MLTFLNQTILFALAGIGIPVLIHFFARRKNSRIIFSSLFFLKAIQNQSIRQLRIRQWILLLLRCLIVMMFVLAFARPVWRKPLSFYPGRDRSAIALVVDRSLSMNRNGLYDSGVRQGLEVAATAEGNDAGLIWIPEDSSRAVKLTHQTDRIQEILKKTSASWMSGSAHESIERAITLLKQSEQINQEIYLISDMQYSSFQRLNLDTAGSGALWQGKIFVWPVTGKPKSQNLGIVDGGISQLIVQPHIPVQIDGHIRNYGDRQTNVLVRAFWDGKAVEQKVVSIEAGETKHVFFKVIPGKGGWQSGSIRIEEDGFNQDNQWFFSCWIPEKVRVLILTGERNEQKPIQLILEQNSGEGAFFEIRHRVFGDQWIDLLDTDVLFILNFPFFQTLEMVRIDQFLNDGGGVFIAPGEKTDINSMNEFPGLSGKLAFGPANGGEAGDSGYMLIGRTDFEHPLFQGVFREGKEKIKSPKFFRYYKVTGHSDPILTLENGDYLTGAISVGKGNLLVMSSGMEMPFSDMVYSGFFGPFVFRSVMYLGMSRIYENESFQVGRTLQLKTPAQSIKSGYYLLTPENHAITLYPRLNREEAVFTLSQPKSPGIYRLYQNDRLQAMAAVNVDPAESDFSAISEKELRKQYPEAKVQFVRGTESLKALVASSRLGRELTYLFLVAAFILLAAEMLIEHTGKNEADKKGG